MKKKVFILFVISFLFLSCNLLHMTDYKSYVDMLEFKNGKYYVEVGEMCVLNLGCEPSDSFSYLDTEYTVSDESICVITDSTDNYCFIQGIKEGTAIITAKLGNKNAKCIVSVQPKD